MAHTFTLQYDKDATLVLPQEHAPIKLVCLDLDDTTLHAGKHFVNGVQEAVDLLMSRGINVAICSGRCPESVQIFGKELGLDRGHGYCICFNGGAIINLSDIKHDLYSKVLEAQDLLDIEAHINQCGGYVHSYTTRRVLLTEHDENIWTQEEIGACQQPHELINYHKEMNPQEKAYKLIACGTPDSLDKARDTLPKEFLNKYYIVRTYPNYLEFMAKGVSKGETLPHLCKILGIGLENVMAFGDGENDLEMIKEAGIGVAVANAHPNLKKAAKYHTYHYRDEGVYQFVKAVLNA